MSNKNVQSRADTKRCNSPIVDSCYRIRALWQCVTRGAATTGEENISNNCFFLDREFWALQFEVARAEGSRISAFSQGELRSLKDMSFER